MEKIGFIDIVGIYAIALLFVAGLLFMTIAKTKNAVGAWRWIARSMDRSTKLVGFLSLVPGIAVAIWLSLRGLQPPVAVIIGLVCAFGLFVATLGILGMEGMLLEPESEALHRLENDIPPPSTKAGRIVATLIGCSIVLSTGGLLYWITTL